MVRFRPICTDTRVPSISITVLPLRYQPRDLVENSLGSASSCWLPMVIATGLAFARKSARVMGQVVFLAMTVVPGTGAFHARCKSPLNGGIIPRPRGATASRLSAAPAFFAGGRDVRSPGRLPPGVTEPVEGEPGD